MAPPGVPDTKVLEGILELQVKIRNAADRQGVAGILVEGLERVPGVSRCLVCDAGVIHTRDEDRGSVPGRCPSPDTSPETPFIGCPPDCPLVKREDLTRFLMHADGREWGSVLLDLQDPGKFEPCRALVAGLVDLAALKLEHMGHLQQRDLLDKIAFTSPIGITVVDRSGRITFANDAAGDILGLTRDDLGHWTFDDSRWKICSLSGGAFPEADLPFNRVMSTGRAVSDVQHGIENVDGRRVLLSINAAPLKDEAGTVTGMVAAITDITARKQAQAEARRNAERLALAVEGTRDGLWDWDLQTNEAYHSDRFATMLGYEPGELPYTSEAWSDLLHPDDVEDAFGSVDDYLKGRSEWYESTFRMRARDGTYRWITGRGKCLRDDQGRPVRFVGFNTDITRRIEAENARRASEEKFRALFEKSPLGVAYHRMVYDEAGNPVDYLFLDANENYQELTGVDPRGKLVTEAFPGIENDPFDWIGTFARAGRDGETIRFQQRLAPNDRWYDVVGFQASPDHFVAAFLEITEQRRLEEQLRQSQKMEAVGQLAGGVAHDFNNLLQVIRGYCDMLLAATPEKAITRDGLHQIVKASDRAANLVSQLLAFSRRQVLEMQVVNLNACVADALKMLVRVIGEHVALDFVPGQDLGPVRADAGQIVQILANLCINARDAMPEGGKIVIRTENVELSGNDCAEREGLQPGPHVRLSVEDTGSGMDTATLARAFDPFFTTKEVGKGTGLGLATVYGLVQQHGGAVHIRSTPGQGTLFQIDLPRVEERPVSGEEEESCPAHGGAETVLLAEDDAMVRELTCMFLEGGGYSVLSAADGKEALAVYADHAARVDLVILDVVMPRLGGRLVYERLREERPDLPVLFVSGYSVDAIHTDFVLEEGLALVQKPFSRDTLLEKVREVLDRNPA